MSQRIMKMCRALFRCSPPREPLDRARGLELAERRRDSRALQLFALAGCALLSGRAQISDPLAPKEPPRATGAVSVPEAAVPAVDAAQLDKVLLPELRGLVFLPDRKAFQPGGVASTDVAVQNFPLLDNADFRAAMRRYLGQPLTARRLNALTREVVLYFREHNRPIVDVLVPEQNVAAGTVQILAIQGRLGRVKAEGNRQFASDQLIGAVRAQQGEVIDGGPLMADIQWLNQNPFRQVDLVYTRGQNPGETDVILRTKDRYPLRVYAGYDDSGNDLTGDERVQAGLNWGNAFGRDQLLSYQLTASPDFRKLVAHSGSYIVPLRQLRHTLTLFGSYADSRPELPGGIFSLKGKTWQTSARYRIPLPGRSGFAQDFAVGVDFKRSNNDLAFGGARVFAQETDVVQTILNYTTSRSDGRGAISFDATLALSPGGITAGNHTGAYRGARSFARPDYGYLRLAFERMQKLPQGWGWTARIMAQAASANLLGSEQIGLGGSQNLRGYEEREANGDNGYMIGNELHGPPLHFLAEKGGARDHFDPLVFVDYGVVWNHDRLPGEPRNLELASAGVGVRYQLDAHVSARLDYGWQLKDSGVSDGRRNQRAHAALTLAY